MWLVMCAWKTSTTPGTADRQAQTRVSSATQKSYKTSHRATVFDRWNGSGIEPIRFDTKIAVLLRDDLEAWQRLNVTAFLVSGIGQRNPDVIGEPYADADGTEYLPMFRQPVLVFGGSKEALVRSCERAVSRDVALAVFTADLFTTGNDQDNRAAVRAVRRADLDLAGLAIYGPRGTVDKIIKGARMHP